MLPAASPRNTWHTATCPCWDRVTSIWISFPSHITRGIYHNEFYWKVTPAGNMMMPHHKGFPDVYWYALSLTAAVATQLPKAGMELRILTVCPKFVVRGSTAS